MDGPYSPYHHGPYLVSWFIFAVLLALLVLAVLYALSRMGRPRLAPPAAPRHGEDDALSALRLRYARGEISRDEYLQASDDLSGAPPPRAPGA